MNNPVNPEAVRYVGYALQLLLVLVLVISLACKSWALLGVCLGAALVLLVLVCIQLLGKNGVKNVWLRKRSTMTYNHNYVDYEYPEWADHLSFEKQAFEQPSVYQPMAPPLYTPPIYQAHTNPIEPMTSSEKASLQIMTMTDRGGSMQAHVLPMYNQRIVPQSMGHDEFAHLNGYMIPVQGQDNEQTPAHLDPNHPDNPMNSLSYLYKH